MYQAKDDGRMAIQRMDATIEQGGLVVLTPDPLVPFANSPLDVSQRGRFLSFTSYCFSTKRAFKESLANLQMDLGRPVMHWCGN